MALYPTPVTIVGLVKDGQVNFLAGPCRVVVEHGHLTNASTSSHAFF